MSFLTKLRKKIRKNNGKGTENVKKAPPRPLESTQLIPVSPIKRKKTNVIWTEHHGTLVRSSAINVRTLVTMPTNVQSQKTRFGLDDLLIGDSD